MEQMEQNWTELKLSVASRDVDTAAAIAQMVVPYGIYIEDYSDLTTEAPRIAHIDLIDEDLLAKDRETAIVHIYINPDENPAEAVSYLTRQLERQQIPYRLDTGAIKEEDWAFGWKKYYHPTLIGKRVVVCPTWEAYTPQGDQVVVRLDPGMAFGTGTHQTTRLCIRELETYVTPGCALLDMGCGSGILSMVALALGAGRAVGIDIDPMAARIARENVAAAGLDQGRFTALCADVIRDTTLPGKIGDGFDLIAANIVADAIIAVCPSFLRFLRPGGMVITSGIISERVGEVTAALAAQGLELVETKESEGWAAVIARRPL